MAKGRTRRGCGGRRRGVRPSGSDSASALPAISAGVGPSTPELRRGATRTTSSLLKNSSTSPASRSPCTFYQPLQLHPTHSLMLTLAPAVLACRRAPSRLIHDGHYTLVRPFSASPAQRHSDPAARRIPAGLAGTAPYHTAYILLHTHLRPAEYPARSRSPLWRALTIRARRWGAVVNFAWAPALRAHPGYAGLGERARPGEEEEEVEVYAASVFSRAHRDRRLEIPEVSLANLDDVDAHLRGVVLGGAPGDAHPAPREAGEVFDRRLHVYVCTHGARDCRCGEGGGAVVRAFERELAKRGIGAEDAVLGELAHVGGHKYAANVLVYPYGDWLGNVQEFDVPRVLDHILDAHREDQHARAEARERPPLCPPFWRGRMGLDKDEQLALLARPAT